MDRSSNRSNIVPPRIAYSIIGAVAGSALVTPLILSVEPFSRLLGGMIFGGPIGAVAGYLIGRRKT